MNAHATIADPILAELIKAHKAREVYPTGHVMRMTREIDDRSRALSVATCECGVIIRLLATKYLEMDGAIEAHWQKFDHADDRGQPVEQSNEQQTDAVQAQAQAPSGMEGNAPIGAQQTTSQAEQVDAADAVDKRTRCGNWREIKQITESGADNLAVVASPDPADAEIGAARQLAASAGLLIEEADDWMLRAAEAMAWQDEPERSAIKRQSGPVEMEELPGRAELWCGDGLDALPLMQANSIDSCVTDPPYHLTARKNGGSGIASLNERSPAGRARVTTGFMGKAWDGGDIAFRSDVWCEVYRVLKPGAYLLAFGGTRTYHRMACAIENAGFEIRDTIMWLYGSGFPKSHDVSKGIDRASGAERKLTRDGIVTRNGYGDDWDTGSSDTRPRHDAPATDAASEWQGWGTALKPACEPIVLARKPLSESTVAANVLKWGTGALNIDGCRVGFAGDVDEAESKEKNRHGDFDSDERTSKNGIYGRDARTGAERGNYNPPGRWPANVIHDGSEEVVGVFPETVSGSLNEGHKRGNGINFGGGGIVKRNYGNDAGSAARFFYTSKADSDDRLGSKHPTVKPLDLMQYLVRLVTPPRGVCLDPFAGTGTTGEACIREGFRAALIEREAEYQHDIRHRMKLAMAGPDERAREAIKAKLKDKPADPGPLFGGSEMARGGGAEASMLIRLPHTNAETY